MADIFISYSREDRASAERLAKALEGQGWSVWWDPHIPAGRTFDEVIEQAIEAANSILVLWSKHSVNSRWVKTEATEGVERGILLPVLIEDVRPPLAFRRIQAANLVEWDGMNSHLAYQKLVSDISRLLGPSPAVQEEEQRKAEEKSKRERQEKDAHLKAAAAQREAALEATRQANEEQARQVKEEAGRKAEKEHRRRFTQAAEAEAVPDAQKQAPDVSPAGSSSLRNRLPLLGGGILVVAVLIAVMSWSPRKPVPTTVEVTVPEPYAPVAEDTQPSVTKPPPSVEQAEPPAIEATLGDLSLSRTQWREVQQALNDMGFDAGANDGIPGTKTRSAIALFQESRGFSPTQRLTESQYKRVLADARLAAEGRLASDPEQTISSARLPEMIAIPAGCFQMGSPADEKSREDDERQHEVCVDAFKIGRTEVTQRQWREVMGDNPSRFKGCDECPVVSVSWHDVQEYLNKLNKRTGKRFRLPTEAEWEYAARAGTTGPFSFQGRISADKANYNAEYTYAGSSKGEYRGKTVPVGSLPANPWGLHEVHGNVWEWTCSTYDENYGGGEQTCADKDDSAQHVIRGGTWKSEPRGLRSANRGRFYTHLRLSALGFRFAQD